MAQVRQSRPDSGLGFQVKVLETFQGVPLFSEAARRCALSAIRSVTCPVIQSFDLVIGVLFVMNLFVGFIVDGFNANKVRAAISIGVEAMASCPAASRDCLP